MTTRKTKVARGASRLHARLGILFEIELDGFKAGKLGEPFSNNPYTFAKVGVSQELFDDEFRPQLDAWWRGWRKSQSILTRGQKAHNA